MLTEPQCKNFFDSLNFWPVLCVTDHFIFASNCKCSQYYTTRAIERKAQYNKCKLVLVFFPFSLYKVPNPTLQESVIFKAKSNLMLRCKLYHQKSSWQQQ